MKIASPIGEYNVFYFGTKSVLFVKITLIDRTIVTMDEGD
jgi:hypothetical protein